MGLLITGNRILAGDGPAMPASVRIEQNRIRDVGAASAGTGRETLDTGDLLVLPGIVDLHGDAFERQLMPRPGVHVDPRVALLDTDRQLLANGITTAFHGLTLSWEPGLRGDAAAASFLAALEAVRPLLACDTRLHLRLETGHLDAVPTVAAWLAQRRIDLLAFNDHLDTIAEKARNGSSLATYTSRTGLSDAGFLALLDRVRGRRDAVPAAVRRLAESAMAHGVPMASHDDETPEMRGRYRDLGCRLCEFPLDAATARAARAAGDPVILGAPNVMRGGSHARRMTASAAIADGLGTVLTSDYYYPSLVQAAFRLARDRVLDLAAAWRLVSINPAAAVGLADRGSIEPGRRADLVLVDDTDPDLPRVVGTIAAGRPVFTLMPSMAGTARR
ncbi:MAG TPA: alpha-D-ribose 1-methylphosphonate 5-triphosphate diphosphatase [Arenibaculum sp.]|nr:alpha-D-ribose 1-methylphosphonate 5-triphosphate diphosphatase [Arenibaculum sp.]